MWLLLMASVLNWQGEQPGISEQTRVEFVLLDVVAWGKKKVTVTDLKREEFVVTENGKPVEVSFFELLDYRPPQRGLSTAEMLARERERPLQQIILALDFESVVRDDVRHAFHNLRNFINELNPYYRYQIDLYSLEHGSLTRGFTEDLGDVLGALESYADGFLGRRGRTGSWDGNNPMFGDSSSGSGNGFSGRSRSSSLIEDVNDLNSLATALEDCLPLREAGCRCMSEATQEFRYEQRERSERVIGELESMAYKFDDSSQLKTMLLVSPGFALHNLRSAEQLLTEYFRRSSACGNRLAGLGKMRIDADFQRVTHACIKNRVIFHTFDIFNDRPSGENRRQLGSAYSSYDREMASGLRELAEESGGTFNRANRLKNAMDKVLERNSYFYVLGYTSPANTARNTYRTIKVKVKRKGVKLRHRGGYYGG